MASRQLRGDPDIVQDAGNVAAPVRSSPYRDAVQVGLRLELGPSVEVPALASFGRLSASFAPDQTAIAYGAGDRIELWDLVDERSLGGFHLDLGGEWLNFLEYSPDGSQIAVNCGDHTIRVLEVPGGKQRVIHKRRARPGKSDYTRRFAYSTDGELIVGGDGNDLVIWSVKRRKELARFLITPSAGVDNVVRCREGMLVCAASDLELWEIDLDEPGRSTKKRTITAPRYVLGVDVSPDGYRCVTGDMDGRVIVWDIASGEQVCIGLGHSNDVRDVAFSGDAAVVASYGEDQTVRLWSATTGEPLHRIDVPDVTAHSVCFGGDGRWLVAGGISNVPTIRLLGWSEGPRVHTRDEARNRRPRCRARVEFERRFELEDSWYHSIAFSRDSKTMFVAAGESLQRWPLHRVGDQSFSPAEASTFALDAGTTAIDVSPDGRHIACACNDGSVRVLDATSGRELHRFDKRTLFRRLLRRSTEPDTDFDVCFTAGGSRVAATHRRDALVWRLFEDGAHVFGSSHISMSSVSSQGPLLAAGCAEVTVWNVETRERVSVIDPTSNALVHDHAFSPDGRQLITGDSSKRLSTWDVASGEELRRHEGHAGEVEVVAFDPLGQMVASYGQDSAVRLWCADTGGIVARIDAPEHPYALAFSPDGRWLAAASRFYPIVVASLFRDS